MLDENYLKKNDAKQDEQLKELNDTLLQISGDIREIMTKMAHFEDRFEEYTKEMKVIRDATKENEKKTSSIMSQQEVIRSRGRGLEKELERLREKFNNEFYQLDIKLETEIEKIESKSQQNAEKSDKDRKWLVTTIVTVAVGFSGIAVTLISIFL